MVFYPSHIQKAHKYTDFQSIFTSQIHFIQSTPCFPREKSFFNDHLEFEMSLYGDMELTNCMTMGYRISPSPTFLIQLKSKPLDEAVYFRPISFSRLPRCWIYLFCSLFRAQISLIFVCWWSLGPAGQLILELPQNLRVVSHGAAVVPKSWAAGRRAGIWTSWNEPCTYNYGQVTLEATAQALGQCSKALIRDRLELSLTHAETSLPKHWFNSLSW